MYREWLCTFFINKSPKFDKGSDPISLRLSPDIFIKITLSQLSAHGFVQEQQGWTSWIEIVQEFAATCKFNQYIAADKACYPFQDLHYSQKSD